LQMVLLGSSVIITVLVINVSFRNPKTHKMSPFLRLVFLEWLPWLTLMNRPGKRFHKPKPFTGSHRSAEVSSDHSSTNESVNMAYKHEPYGGISHLVKGNSTASLLRFTRAVSGVGSHQTDALLRPLIEKVEDVHAGIGKSWLFNKILFCLLQNVRKNNKWWTCCEIH
jgi:hypothetical protein